MIIFFILVFGVYFLLLLCLRIGWERAVQKKEILRPEKKNFISVVIAMRNEESNLNQLLSGFLHQSYSQNNFEIIIIDDHSEDNSVEELFRWKGQLPIISISLDKNESGKKAALTKGIARAKGEIIVTTDADCMLPALWLEQINYEFQNEQTNLVIGLVSIDANKKFFDQLQTLEFASVIGTGVATFGLGRPTMCNGANLSFRKKSFEAVNGYSGNEHIASGDDEFLMRKIDAQFPNSIQVLNSEDSVVSTRPRASVDDFIQQRLRWASKWKANSSFLAKSLAVLIFTVQASWFVLIVNSFIYPILFLIVIIKALIDFIFIYPITKFLKIRFKIGPFLTLQFIYPLYVLYIGIFSQLGSHQWKGRKF